MSDPVEIPVLGVFRHEHRDTDRSMPQFLLAFEAPATVNGLREDSLEFPTCSGPFVYTQDGRKLMAEAGLDPVKVKP